MPQKEKTGARILIVDDDEDLRNVVQGRLVRQGYKVRIAADGEAAFEAVRAQIPDLILLDVNLPDLSGYEISRRIKEEMTPHVFVPIVFVTGQGELPEKLKGFASGGDDYLVKPFHGDELDARIRSMLKIKALQDDLRAVNVELQALTDLKDQLTHLLVHDLRVPLSNLLVGAQRLLQKTGHGMDADQMRLWGVVQDSGRHLVEMIDNILDVARLEEGRLPLKKVQVDLKAFLEGCLAQAADAARYRKTVLEAGPAAGTLEADERMLTRAVANLLLNAIKVSPPGSTVRLECARETGKARMSVLDAGPAIPEDQRTRIFDQYFQAEQGRQGRVSGIGYGLIFCRLVAESHGGSISVEPAEKGNRFVLTLPV